MDEGQRTPMVTRRTTFRLGVIVGAAAMYLLDPEHGAVRRARLRASLVGAPRTIAGLVDDLRASLTDAGERLDPSSGPGAPASPDGARAAWPAAEDRPRALR